MDRSKYMNPSPPDSDEDESNNAWVIDLPIPRRVLEPEYSMLLVQYEDDLRYIPGSDESEMSSSESDNNDEFKAHCSSGHQENTACLNDDSNQTESEGEISCERDTSKKILKEDKHVSLQNKRRSELIPGSLESETSSSEDENDDEFKGHCYSKREIKTVCMIEDSSVIDPEGQILSHSKPKKKKLKEDKHVSIQNKRRYELIPGSLESETSSSENDHDDEFKGRCYFESEVNTVCMIEDSSEIDPEGEILCQRKPRKKILKEDKHVSIQNERSSKQIPISVESEMSSAENDHNAHSFLKKKRLL